MKTATAFALGVILLAMAYRMIWPERTIKQFDSAHQLRLRQL